MEITKKNGFNFIVELSKNNYKCTNCYKKLDNEIPLEEIPDLTTATSTDRINCSLSNMTFKGLYSKNYTE